MTRSNIEARWYPAWENAGYFKAGLDTSKNENFCIQLPPPNVTGTLHMGHGFNQTLMDALTRYHRMRGDNTLWQPGTDHAGIATQIVVERQLDAQGISRHDLGREKFIEKVWEWKEYSGNTITSQMRRLGTSPDWSRERFTMDEGLSRSVTETFVRLFNEGLIYRGKRLVNWDRNCTLPSRTWRWCRKKKTVSCTTSAIRWRWFWSLDRCDHPPGNHARRRGGNGASRG